MNKTYIKPTVKVVVPHCQTMLAGISFDNNEVDLPVDEEIEDEGWAE